MNADQANELKGYIFSQLLQFDECVFSLSLSLPTLLDRPLIILFCSSPPFTIQRLCELCVRPKEHYNSLGKYLRAIEKSVLVTSTHSAFPPLPPSNSGLTALSVPLLSATPATPLFSPIPFLHEDARRSKSSSPPPSPLVLISSPDVSKALGLVDELDDPRPGHLSDHIQPLTATTTTTVPGKPLFGSLDDRFVKAGEEPENSLGGGSEGARRHADGPEGEKESKL